MRLFLHKYAQFLRQRDVATMMGIALVARMPIGMVAFSMLMFLRERLGSFALAGAAVGVHFVAMAAAAPVQGRLIDRLGPRGPLLLTGSVQPLALAAVAASALAGMPFAVVAAAAALAGAFSSPITVITRTLWRHRFEGEEDRRTAFALDAVLIEINFMMGPAIVAALLATAGVAFAFLFSIAIVVAAVMLFMASPMLGYFRREADVERHLLGPLTEPRLWLLFAASFGLCMCFGILEVGYPAYATSLGAPALGGVILAINSMGSAVGGAIFGGLHLRASVERQFTTTLALMVAPLLLHVVAVPLPIAFGAVAFLAGALIAPTIASQAVLVSRLAPSKYATEAFTWSSTFIVSGLGAGTALAGHLVETHGIPAAFAVAAAIVAAVALLSLPLQARGRVVPATPGN